MSSMTVFGVLLIMVILGYMAVQLALFATGDEWRR